MTNLWKSYLKLPPRGFLGCDIVTPDRVETPFVFLGVPFGPPYGADDLTEALSAPSEIRGAYDAYPWTSAEGFNFEWAGTLSRGTGPKLSDVGDVEASVEELEELKQFVSATVGTLLSRGSIPLVQGGLDSVPPLIVSAFEDFGPVNILHIDCHLDFRDDFKGMRDGYSSPIRRIREMPWVDSIVQVGLRGSGSATEETVNEAVASGNRIIPAREFKRQGVQQVLDSLDMERKWIISLDCDGLDPSIAPAVAAKEPGGLDYYDALGIVEFLSMHDRLAAFICTEFVPALDVGGTTANTVSRLFAAAVAMHRTPQ